MRFRILGPLQISDENGEVVLRGQKQRTVLALLLANAGKIVSWEHLLDAVWDDDPPPTARRQIQNCVAALRRLVPTGSTGEPLIVTDGPGYRVAPEEGDLDAWLFDRHVVRARALAEAGRPAEAVAEFRTALSLWQGPALFGVPGRVVEAVAATLDDQRLTVVQECVDLELSLGGHGRLVGELTALVAANPLREPLVGQLMLALYRCGRQAEALQAYHRLRAALADELGVDPGAALQQTCTAILTNDPAAAAPSPDAAAVAVEAPPPAVPADGPAPARPGHLPRPVPDFVGRSAILASLIAAVPGDGTPAVLSIAGMAGVGKTTLAVRLAHRLAGRYPDAQLYVDLHGYAEREPEDPGGVLSILLRQLGVAAQRVPKSADDRATLWRAELAGRRVLVLLDNAAGSKQVVPLLPGESDTLVVVTSRRMLAGLDGVRAVSLGALPPAESVELLRRIVGARATAAPEAAAELARLCGDLPLALRLAAARLVRRTSWAVADLNERLRDTPARLSQLKAEDRAVAAALDLSYQQLDAVTRWVFRALGRHARTGFDRHAAAALAGLDAGEVDVRLEELVDAYLLETPAAGRYRLHDLVHDYASARLAAESPERAEAAERRLLAHYLHTTANATAHYERPVSRAVLVLDEPPPSVPRFGGTEQAVAWLDANWVTVVAAVELADARGHDEDTWRLSRALWAYLYRNTHNDELVAIHQRALGAVARLGDDAAAATIHSCIAAGYANLKRYDATEHHLRERFTALRRLGDHRGIISTLNNLALLQLYGAAKPRDAVATCQEALGLAERYGAEHDVYLCLRTLGMAYRMLGRNDDALTCLQRALAGFESAGELSWHSLILGELGGVYTAIGDHATAVPLLRRALQMKQSEGNRSGSASIRTWLGEAYQAMGRAAEALESHRAALALEPQGDFGGSKALNGYGRTLLAQGSRAEALDAHRRALTHGGQADNRYEAANAHAGIAAALCDAEPAAAHAHWQQALEIYEDMGVPEASEVRRSLAGLSAPALAGPERRPGKEA